MGNNLDFPGRSKKRGAELTDGKINTPGWRQSMQGVAVLLVGFGGRGWEGQQGVGPGWLSGPAPKKGKKRARRLTFVRGKKCQIEIDK